MSGQALSGIADLALREDIQRNRVRPLYCSYTCPLVERRIAGEALKPTSESTSPEKPTWDVASVQYFVLFHFSRFLGRWGEMQYRYQCPNLYISKLDSKTLKYAAHNLRLRSGLTMTGHTGPFGPARLPDRHLASPPIAPSQPCSAYLSAPAIPRPHKKANP